MERMIEQRPFQRYKLYKDGKALVTALMLGTLMIGGSLLTNHTASADSGRVAYNGKDGYVKFDNGQSEPVVNLSMDGQVVFCINPFVLVQNGALATPGGQTSAQNDLWAKLSSYQRALINNVAWVGQSQGAATDRETYMATQIVVWQLLAGQNGVPGIMNGSGRVDASQLTNTMGTKVTGWDSNLGAGVVNKAQSILDNAAALSQVPEFSAAPLNVTAGGTAELAATNGVDLSKFKYVRGDNSISMVPNGSGGLTLSVADSASAGTHSITLDTGINRNNVSYVYGVTNPDGSEGQPLYGAKDPSRQAANVQVEVKKANLKIDKSILKAGMGDSKQPTNGNYSLSGNVFEVHKDTADGPVVRELTTDDQGQAETGPNMDYGRYVITEKQASQGLNRSWKPVTVDLNGSGQIEQTARGDNQEVTGGIKIQKTGAESGTQQWNANYSLKDNVFKIHKDSLDGEVVAEVSTDANGVAESAKNLPLGHYVVEEVQASKGFLKTFKPQEVDIKYAGQEVPIVIAATGGANQEVKGQLIIDKSGAQSGKNMINNHYSLAGNEFDIFDEQNRLVDHVVTDASGKAYSKTDLKLGKYTVVETKASEGFAKTAQPQKVALTYNGQQTPVVFDTAYAQNQEVKGGITIQKTGAETGTQMWNNNYSLSGNVFKIHKGDINGEVVDEVSTDANGYAHTREDLPLGHYVVEEVQASKGFVKTFQPKDVDINYAGQDVPLVLSMTSGSNQEVKGQLVIDKSGATSGKQMINGHYSLAGNEFDILNEGGQVVDHVVTDASGKAYSKADLKLGKYTVKETKASEGFAKTAQPQKVELAYAGQQVPVVMDTAYAQNQEVKGGISIQKTGAESGTQAWNANYSLVGNVFKIHKDNLQGDVVAEVATDANGHAETPKDLPLGHYVVEEVQASKGFLKTFKPQEVDIKYAGQEVPIVIAATGGTNQEVKGQLIIDKSGAQSGKNMINNHYSLAGNEFDIFDEQNRLVDHVVTDASGKAYSKTDLKLGKYTVVETKASEGFAKTADPQKVALTYNGQQTPVVFDTAYAKNQEVKGGITIQKTGAESGKQQWNGNYSLAGNVFKIHKDSLNGEVVDEVTTDANGYAKTREDLPLGHYVVEEVQASKGFVKTFQPKDVDINYAGQDVPLVLSMTEGTNQEVKGQLVIDKSGATSGKQMINGHYSLAGNEFDIFDEQNHLVDHVTTDASGKAYSKNGLKLGKYTVVETKASEGFAKTAQPQKVELSYAGQQVPVVFDTAYAQNQEVKGGIKIQKTGAESGTQQWNANYSLKDNVFKIHKDSLDGEVVAEVSTDANGVAETAKDLPLGHYVVEEVQASKGFLKTFKPQDVNIKYAGQEVPIVIAATGGTNQEVKGQLIIDKSGAQSGKNMINNHYSLAGNEFDIFDEQNHLVDHVTTDASGKAYSKNDLKLGKYTVVETKASEGFAKTAQPQKVALTYNGQQTPVVFDTAYAQNQEVKGGIKIQKTGAESGTQQWNANYSLKDNVFKIHKDSLNGEVVAEVSTDANGVAETAKDLPLGHYVVEEVQASQGFLKTFKPQDVDITYASQEVPIVIAATGGTNQEVKGRIVIDKSGVSSGKKMINDHYTLEGNEFDILDEQGNVVDHVTTDASGKGYSKTDLKLGKYTVKETKASEGFAKTAEDRQVTLSYNGQDQAVVFDTANEKNQEVFGGIQIHKEGMESGKNPWNANYSLKDNVFAIHKDSLDGEVVAEVSTDANGYANTALNLPLGHYVVEEKQASTGFLKTFKPQEVDIKYAGQEVPIVIAATGGTNQEVKGQLIIDKSGATSGKNMINEHYTLAGNEFDIFDEQNQLVDHVTTDASGKAYSKTDLKLGKYTVKETKASEGFAKTADPQKVALTYNGQQTPVVFDTAYAKNQEVKGGITIQKTGAETGTQQWNNHYSLAGNVFKIHKDNLNGDVVDEVTTDANGYAKTREDLPLGHYVVEEVQASKGFVKTFQPKDVDINYAGQDVPLVLSMTEGTNQEVKGKIVVDKSGLESGKKQWNGNYSLAGNVFDVHEGNELGRVVAQMTTDDQGHAETSTNLPLGDYVVTESKASKGFTKTFKPQKVSLKYAGQKVALVADLARDTNQEVTGETTVTKQDKQTGDNTQGRATFAGAEYTLYHQDGTPVKWRESGQPTPEVTVGKKVNRDQVTLRIDEDLNQAGVKHLALGDYYWQETKAPEGYQIDKKQYQFAINYQDEYTPVVTNDETSQEQVINFSFDGFKYVKSASGSAQSGYNGIQLKMIPINGTKGEPQVVTTETDANGYDGYYRFNNLAYGDYELWEVNAPEGFQHIEPLYVHIRMNADKTAYVFTVNEKGQEAPIKTMTVPVSQINEQSDNIYLSKLFLFDASEKHNDCQTCAGGGQPNININNSSSANPVINTNANPSVQNNPAINANPSVQNNPAINANPSAQSNSVTNANPIVNNTNQQQQEEHQQQANGNNDLRQEGGTNNQNSQPSVDVKAPDVHQTTGSVNQEGQPVQISTGRVEQTGSPITQTGAPVHQETGAVTQGGAQTEQKTGAVEQAGSPVHQQTGGVVQEGAKANQTTGAVEQTGSPVTQNGGTMAQTANPSNNVNQQQQQQQQQQLMPKIEQQPQEEQTTTKQTQTQPTQPKVEQGSNQQTQEQHSQTDADPQVASSVPKQSENVTESAPVTESTQPQETAAPVNSASQVQQQEPTRAAAVKQDLPSTGKKAKHNAKPGYLALGFAAASAIVVTGNFDQTKQLYRKKKRLALKKKATA
ncbi:SpaA isopeptide-forming pilin-related protein [Leuconostocaceae bacterium ESL0958]|nr:SpaA isopeptide-forming pilin-related protein [Leuconostocaceae bacterium ESL0958]